MDRPEFAHRERLKATLRGVRPLVEALEPRFQAEDREEALRQRPATPGRRRYRA